jgi:hypothetical protein
MIRERLRLLEDEAIPGGLARHDKPSDFDPHEIMMGIKVEKEHLVGGGYSELDMRNKAREIAMDHLKEIPDYYTRLKKMEKGAGVEEDIQQIHPSTRQQLIDFVKSQPNLDDSAYHAFAERLGVSPHEAEEVIYDYVRRSAAS